MLYLPCLQALADMVTEEDLEQGRVYPPLKGIRQVSEQLAARIVSYAYRRNMAAHYPEPKDKLAFVRDHMYNTDYESFIPDTYAWPGMQEWISREWGFTAYQGPVRRCKVLYLKNSDNSKIYDVEHQKLLEKNIENKLYVIIAPEFDIRYEAACFLLYCNIKYWCFKDIYNWLME